MNLTLLKEILQLIEEYGLPLVFLLFMLFTWFIPWVKDLQKKSEKEDKDESQFLEQIISAETDITEILCQVANDLHCQWAVLWQFHNGISSMDGVPFIRMSVTHEFNAPTVEPRLPKYQSVPISVFIDALIVLQKNGELYIKQDSPFPSLVNSYKRDGVDHGMFVRVNNVAGKMIGVLSVSFDSPDVVHTEQDCVSMKGYAARISILLSQLAHLRTFPKRRSGDARLQKL